eukprot:IDg22138t1
MDVEDPPSPVKRAKLDGAGPFAAHDRFAPHDPFAPRDPFAQGDAARHRPWWQPKLGAHTMVEAGLSAWAPWWAMATFRLSACAWLLGFAAFVVAQRPSQLLSLDVLNHFTLAGALLLLAVCSACGERAAHHAWLPPAGVALYH